MKKRLDVLLSKEVKGGREDAERLRKSITALRSRIDDIESCERILRKAADASIEAGRKVKLVGVGINNRMLGTLLVSFVSVVGSALVRIMYFE